MKKIIAEMKEVTWLNGRSLAQDTSYVLLFTGILLAYFAVVDKVLTDIVEKFFVG